MSDAALKPCPFCGGDVDLGAVTQRGKHYVMCDNLDCMGPVSDAYPTLEEAALQWNIRTAPSAEVIRGMVKPLVWDDSGTITRQVIGRRPYKVFRHDDCFSTEVGLFSIGTFDTPEEAQAAANTHHANTILAALGLTE